MDCLTPYHDDIASYAVQTVFAFKSNQKQKQFSINHLRAEKSFLFEFHCRICAIQVGNALVLFNLLFYLRNMT